MATTSWRTIVEVGAVLAFSAVLGVAQTGDRPDFSDEAKLRQYLVSVAERIQTPAKCGECHKSEFQVWQGTRHATQFQDLHTTERAKKIYKALGLQLIRRATEERTPACLACHYTPQATADGIRAQISVGCESCHGPARDWIGVHNNYGVKEPDSQKAVKLETPEHKAQRIADAKAKGMRRPSEIYDVGANCFQCHTVPNETLVDKGGHSTGSDFELVSWSQKIRHNFLQSALTGDGKSNAETSPGRKRILYVAGRALALEYSLRGIAVATKDDTYLQAMVDRNGYAVDALAEITSRVAIPEIQAMLDAFKNVALKANNRAALLAAADRIGAATKQFIARADPSKLSSLDALWNPAAAGTKTAAAPPAAEKPVAATAPLAEKPATTARPGAAAADTGSAKAATPAPVATTPRPPESSKAPAAATPSSATPPPQTARASEPARRPSWRPQPTHEFLQVPCGKCHDPQTRWWRGDRHSKAVEPFRDGGSKQQQIAAAFGISAADINAGNQICMSCHGTIVGSPTAKVRAGVGCQMCHGPGADYKEPHQKNRQQALGLGLVDLKNASVRAETCAGCHYITEPRLIAAGHPSGDDFKIDARTAKIKHWGADFEGNAVDVPAPQLMSAYTAVLAKRGPVPRVARAPVAPPLPAAASIPEAPKTTTPEPAGRAAIATAVPEPRASAEPPGARASGSTAAATRSGSSRGSAIAQGGGETKAAAQPQPPPETPPPATESAALPEQATTPLEIGPNDSVEEVLLKLKVRLTRLYELARKAGSR